MPPDVRPVSAPGLIHAPAHRTPGICARRSGDCCLGHLRELVRRNRCVQRRFHHHRTGCANADEKLHCVDLHSRSPAFSRGRPHQNRRRTGDVIDVGYLDTLWEFGGQYLSTSDGQKLLVRHGMRCLKHTKQSNAIGSKLRIASTP